MRKFQLLGNGLKRSKQSLAWLVIATFMIVCSFSISDSIAQGSFKTLKTATYGWRPFVYENLTEDAKIVTGLDVELANLAFARIGYDVVYEEEMSWDALLADLQSGKKDIVISALKRPAREQYAYYSDVFRSSVNVLYLPKQAISKYQLQSGGDILKLIKDESFRLGVVEGYAYGDAQIDSYVRDFDNTQGIVTAANDEELFDLLTQKRIDGFLVDQIVGADIAYRRGLQSIVGEYPLRVSELPYYVIFSKKTTSPALVKKFNDSVINLRKTGDFSAHVRHYLFPVLLSFTTGQRWYFLVELVGVISFAASGLILANKGGYDIFGAFVLAALPGVGGGVLRDILARRSSLGVMKAPTYILAVVCTVVVGYALIQIVGWLKHTHKIDLFKSFTRWFRFKLPINAIIELLDALGLSTLSIIGVIVALETQSSPLWLWGPIFAAITSAGGGILRDVVRVDPDNPSLKGSFYPLIAVIWGLIFSWFLLWYSSRSSYYPHDIFVAVMIVIFGSFFTRIWAVLFNVNTPSFAYQIKGSRPRSKFRLRRRQLLQQEVDTSGYNLKAEPNDATARIASMTDEASDLSKAGVDSAAANPIAEQISVPDEVSGVNEKDTGLTATDTNADKLVTEEALDSNEATESNLIVADADEEGSEQLTLSFCDESPSFVDINGTNGKHETNGIAT